MVTNASEYYLVAQKEAPTDTGRLSIYVNRVTNGNVKESDDYGMLHPAVKLARQTNTRPPAFSSPEGADFA